MGGISPTTENVRQLSNFGAGRYLSRIIREVYKPTGWFRSYGWQLIAFETTSEGPLVFCCHTGVEGVESFLSHLDTAPDEGDVRGTLPPAVYADWIEENGVAVPSQVLELLRS